MSDDPEAGLAEASAILQASLSGQQASAPQPATPTPSPEATPAAPAAEPAPSPAEDSAVPAPPAPPTEAQAVPPVPTLNVQDPAAKRFLEMHGGDPEKALAAALAYNNRLAQLAKLHPEAFHPGGAADPGLQITPEQSAPFLEPPPPPAPVPVQIDPAQIQQEVNLRVKDDPYTQPLVRTYVENDTELRKLNTEYQRLTSQVNYLQAKLADDDLKLDEIGRADVSEKLRTARFELGITKNDAYLLRQHQRELEAQFTEHRSRIEQGIVEQYKAQAAERAASAQLAREEQTAFTEFKAAWPAALDRAVTQYKIPPDQVAKFKQYAKLHAQAYHASSDTAALEPVQLDTFLGPIAQGYLSDMDAYHRARAAQYGAQAQARAASPAPVSAPGSGVPPATPPTDPDEALAEANRILREGLRRGVAFR